MFNKNITLLLLGFLFLLIVTLLLFLVSNLNQPPVPSVSPSPISQPTSLPSPLADPLQQQTQADINYAEIQNKVLKEYPWYNDFPLQEIYYFVLFDPAKKVFRAKLYPQKSSSISIDDQVKSYQQEIISKLSNLGVDTSLYQIEWVINPE